MNEDNLKSTLDEIDEEILALDVRIAELFKFNERRAILFNLGTQARLALSMGPYPPRYFDDLKAGRVPIIDPLTMVVQPPPPPIKTPKQTIWQCAKRVLSQANEPLDLDDIVQALCSFHNFKFEGRSGRETVRAVLFKKPELFERVGDGQYRLKK